MRIAVCDDEAIARKSVVAMIRMSDYFTEDMEILEFTSGEELLRWYVQGHSADIIFLDIEMDRLSGIDTAKKIRSRDSRAVVIFASSHSEQVIDTFECEPFNFMVKPFTQERFDHVFKRAYTKCSCRSASFLVTWKNESIRLPIRTIKYVEKRRNHVVFCTTDGDYPMVTTLSETLSKLAPYHFVQTHQGYLVNLAMVKYFDKQDIVLQDGTRVMVSVRKRAEASAKFSTFLKTMG